MKKKLFRKLKRLDNKKIEYQTVLNLFDDIANPGLNSVEKEEELINILESLAKDNLLRLPEGGRYYDLSGPVSHPKFIVMQHSESENQYPWRNKMWSPQLSWIAGISYMKHETFLDFEKIDQFIRKTNEPDPLPEKERSLMIFGDEKRLQDLHQRYNDRVDLYELTYTYTTNEPLVFRKYSASTGRGIIIENRDTFDSFCRVNQDYLNYDIIVYGNGLNILQYKSFLDLKPLDIKTYEYFGDIDPTGLSIGQSLSIKLAKLQIMVDMSFRPYYHKLIELYQQQDFEFKSKKQNQSYSLEFIPSDFRELVSDLFEKNLRIPQELLNRGEIERIFQNI